MELGVQPGVPPGLARVRRRPLRAGDQDALLREPDVPPGARRGAPGAARARDTGTTLSALRAALGPVRICSVLAPVDCAGCGEVQGEIASSTSQVHELPCPQCGVVTRVALDPEVRSALVLVPNISAYLADRKSTRLNSSHRT